MLRFASALLLVAIAAPVRGAEVTELWSPFPTDAADVDGDRAVGARVGLTWRQRTTTESVDREFVCLAHEVVDGSSLCPERSGIRFADDLEAETTTSELELDFRMALWRTIELRVRLPIILSDETALGFADGVDGKNSLTAPYNADQTFSVPHRASRSGLGDPSLALWATPLARVRDVSSPTLALGLELGLPLAAVRSPGTDGVGSGIFSMTFAIAGSARVQSWLEPFARFDVTLALAASNELYPDRGETQTISGPAQRVGFKAGAELVPYERAKDRSAVRIELGGELAFISAGRAPTVLFDAIGTSPCSTREPGAADPCSLTTTATGARANGTTVEEEHLALGTWLAVHYDVFETLRISARASASWQTPHFLTFSDVGVDVDDDGDVDSENSDGEDERDPDYVESWDEPGSRFRSASELTLGVDLSVSVRF